MIPKEIDLELTLLGFVKSNINDKNATSNAMIGDVKAHAHYFIKDTTKLIMFVLMEEVLYVCKNYTTPELLVMYPDMPKLRLTYLGHVSGVSIFDDT